MLSFLKTNILHSLLVAFVYMGWISINI